ncbi:glycosyltransferase [Thermodesulfobacteriota bacterium]
MKYPKKILMITSAFPPEADVGGIRPAMFSKYLPGFGWHPLIFSRSRPVDDPEFIPAKNIDGLPDESKVFRIPYGKREEDIAIKHRTFGKRLKHIFVPEEANPPGLFDRMLSESYNLLKKNSFDIIWATSPSLYTLKIAAVISKISKIPWVADLRDIDEQQFFRWDGIRIWALRRRMIMRRNYIIKSTSLIITVSRHHAKILSKNIKRKVHIIRNGFDPEMFFNKTNDVHNFPKFSITYMGFILKDPRGRDPRPLFEALDNLINENEIIESNINVNFYGIPDQAPVKEILEPYRCRNIVKLFPLIPYNEVPSILMNSCILLTLTDHGRKGILTTKTFEYLGARRPILFIPGDNGELDDILNKANAGISCSTVESIVKILRKWYNEWCKTGRVAYHGYEEEIMKYSRKEQTGQLAKLLNDVILQKHIISQQK